MCTVCGCNETNHAHEHSHDRHHYGHGAARLHIAGMSQEKIVQVEQDILSKNNNYANANRAFLAAKGILTLNLVSSPGSGKTTILETTLKALKTKTDLNVIEGDQQTSQDADRIKNTGVPVVQVNTGKGCHLDAHMIEHALDDLKPKDDGILFIENVGNLVCPAAFDLGENCKVVILSVTEGEDKPLKYPDMFAAADLMLLNKVDLLPHLDFDVDKCIEYARQVNPRIKVLKVSATSGVGMDNWFSWLGGQSEAVQAFKLQGGV